MFFVVKVKGEILDYWFLARGAGDEKRICCWFSRLNAVVSIPTGLGVTRGPPEISFCW
jgi:hypothetical protein